MKNLLLLILCLLPLTGFAEKRSETAMHDAAVRWFMNGRNVLSHTDTPSTAVSLLRSTPRAQVYGCGQSFVLVSTDDCEPLILGYGTSADRQKRTAERPLPAPLRALLTLSPTAWNKGMPVPSYLPEGAVWTPVPPLLTTVRHQEEPYNNACPYLTDASGTPSAKRCVVGCVATAMEQILTYYRRTYTLLDTLHGWETELYQIPDILPGETVDTRLILDSYDHQPYTAEEADAVARLSYYLGVACRMNWGLSESGANSRRLAEPLRRAFGLKYVHYLDSYKYPPTVYWNYLAAELLHRRPIYYAGSIMRTGGHAFVLDGLDERGFFHVNWGYGGDYDGYFRLDVLAHPQPEADRAEEFVESGFFCNQEAIVVCPDSLPGVLPPDTLQRSGTEIAIDSLFALYPPLTGCYTPVKMFIRNTSTQSLTTPFALMLNELTDTSLTEQALWLNFTGRTLAPGQRDTLTIHSLFSRSGSQLLSVSPDGEKIIRTVPVSVTTGGTQEVGSHVPQVTFPATGTAEVEVTLFNPDKQERASQYFVYDLVEEATGESRQVERFVYLSPGETTTQRVRFRSLLPGHAYRLQLRRRWPVVQTVRFTLPASAAAIDRPLIGTELNDDAPIEWYTPDGRRTAAPGAGARGIFLKKQGRHTLKVCLPNP